MLNYRDIVYCFRTEENGEKFYLTNQLFKTEETSNDDDENENNNWTR